MHRQLTVVAAEVVGAIRAARFPLAAHCAALRTTASLGRQYAVLPRDSFVANLSTFLRFFQNNVAECKKKEKTKIQN